jgi:hypothetical protein
MKIIKVSDAVHKRMIEDKKEFAKAIGISFTFNDVIKEYHTILYSTLEDVRKKQ